MNQCNPGGLDIVLKMCTHSVRKFAALKATISKYVNPFTLVFLPKSTISNNKLKSTYGKMLNQDRISIKLYSNIKASTGAPSNVTKNCKFQHKPRQDR